MNYANIKYFDVANGDGVRTSLFVSGCPHHCKGCFNEVAWDYNYGNEYNEDVLKSIVESIKPYYIAGASILGGEPLAPDNMNCVAYTVKYIKDNTDNKNIWLYSGYTWEEIIENNYIKENILPFIDILVDGRFIEELKDISLKFKGSSNQRIIDVKKSLKSSKVELYYE